MTDRPLVSVLVATYNRADVLPRALDSVFEQTYNPLEVIVVDDHSDEDIEAVVDAYNDERLTFDRHAENRGWGAAMNTAFGHASGSYLAMIGDDDEWSDPEKVANQIRVFENQSDQDVGIVATGWNVVSASTGEVVETCRPTLPPNLERHILGENRLIQSISAVVTREAWEAVDGTDESIPRGIDSDLFRRMIFAGYEVVLLPDPMINVYVDRDDRMTAKRTESDIRPHIDGELAKFEKFPEAFERYPWARARVLEKVAGHRLTLYRLTGDPSELADARERLVESIRANPRHWKAWARLSQSLWLQVQVGLGL